MRLHLLLLALFCALASFAQIEFIPNKGQFYDFNGNLHPEVLFKVERPNGNVYFKKDGLFFQFFQSEEKQLSEYSKEELTAYERGDYAMAGTKTFYYQMDFNLLNTNPDVSVEMRSETSMVRNYYLAHCPQGILNVKASKEIVYKNIYPNIDLRFYSQANSLKYDFILHPGANYEDIQFAYEGFDRLSLVDGGINIENPVTNFTDAAPIAETENGKKIRVELTQHVHSGSFGYTLGTFPTTETVIIDPTMEWGTYFNGASSATWTRPVFDSNGNMYNAGYTSDASFPVLNAGAGQYFDGTKDGSNDLVIVKFNADHSQAWATYYGGDNSDYLAGYTDYGKAIAINNSDEIYVAGLAASGTTTFPTFNPGGGAWYQDQSKIYGETSFVLKFDENGVRQWATIFQHENSGSTSSEAIRINGIVSDGSKLYFTGQLYNWNGSGIPLRTLSGAYNNGTYVGAQDPFIGRFDTALDLEWCTYLNGGNPANQAYSQGVDLHVDGLGNLWFVGRESIGDPGSHVLMNPGGGAYYQATHGGDQDLIITKFNSSMSIVWSTYYGGDGQDIPSMITTDNNDNPLIVCRSVKSTNWPTTDPGGGAFFDNTLSAASNQESGILKFTNAGAASWCTYIGGTGTSTSMTGIGVDPNNNIYVTGSTNSTDFPLMNESGSYYDGTNNGGTDAVFTRFTPGGVMEWGTYYGGSGNESLYSGKGAVLNSPCGADIAAFGYTASTDIGLVNPGSGAYYQSTSVTSNNFIFYFAGTGGSTSTDPSGISGTSSICSGDMITLSVSGSTLDPNDEYYWYTGSCGGTAAGTGSSISVSPTSNTTYFVRAEGSCGETNCATLSVTVNPIPDVNSVSDQTICNGDESNAVNFSGSVSGTSFSWTNNNTAIGLAASGNGDIAAFAGNASSGTETATISVSPEANGCTGAPISFTITVNAVNNAVSSVDGITLTASASSAQYQWVDCNDNYSWVNGETSQSFTPGTNGSYAVIVTENGCSDTSSCQVVNSIGLDENGSLGLMLYPNPSSGKFTIVINQLNEAYTLVVTDARGKLIYEQEITKMESEIDLSAFAEGSYHVCISGESGNVERIPLVLIK